MEVATADTQPRARRKRSKPARRQVRDTSRVVAAVLDLRAGECRWPVGDPRSDDFTFCRAEALPGISYCETHSREASGGRPAIAISARMLAA